MRRLRACASAAQLLRGAARCAGASGPPPHLQALLCAAAPLSHATAHAARLAGASPLLPPAAQSLARLRRGAHGDAKRAHDAEATPSEPRAASAVATPPSAPSGLPPLADDDAPPRTWLDDVAPRGVLPFLKLARLDAPTGTALLFWPCAWSIALAAPAGQPPDAQLLALFAAGALLLRGAGCTVNDLWDRDIDAKVARTRHRPLASGALKPSAAVAFLAAQLGAGLGILLQLNEFSILVGAASLGGVFAYPLMKRVTDWPQAFLGLVFNWGALLGWAAARGSLDWVVVGPLYGAGVAWTLVYDTIYAHQDISDDERVGVRSTARRFGDATPAWLTGFSVAMLAGLAAAGAAAHVGAPYYAAVAAAGGHLAWQIGTVDLTSRADCAAKFRSNAALGGLLFAGAVAGKLAAAPEAALQVALQAAQ